MLQIQFQKIRITIINKKKKKFSFTRLRFESDCGVGKSFWFVSSKATFGTLDIVCLLAAKISVINETVEKKKFVFLMLIQLILLALIGCNVGYAQMWVIVPAIERFVDYLLNHLKQKLSWKIIYDWWFKLSILIDFQWFPIEWFNFWKKN